MSWNDLWELKGYVGLTKGIGGYATRNGYRA